MASGYTQESLTRMYLAECVLPDTEPLRALTDQYITPFLADIERDMYELRAETDAHFRALLAKGARLEVDEGLNAAASKYPVSFCLEITRHMLKLMAREPAPHMTGLKALQAFVRAGGPVKRIWGALRGGYFQNATQVGTYYLDVANDTVNPKKPQVELVPMATSNFNNIKSYFEFANVGETYWKGRIIPNRYFPNVATYLPAIVFDKDGSIRLEGRSSYMFPMNMLRRFEPAYDFLMAESDDEALAPLVARLSAYAARDPRCANPTAPLWFAESPRDTLAAKVEHVRALNGDDLTAEINRVLGPETHLLDSGKTGGALPSGLNAEI